MPAIEAITLNTGGSTPVDVQFVPVNQVGDVSYFRNAGETSLSDKLLSVSARTTPAGYHKVAERIVIPVVSTDTDTGVKLVVRKSHYKHEASFAPDATEEEMIELFALAHASLAAEQALLSAVFTQRANVY